MALTETEKTRVQFLREKGLDNQQIMARIAKDRAGLPQFSVQEAPQEEGRFDDVGEDLATGARGVVSDIKERGENLQETIEAGASGDQTTIETGLQAAGQFAGAAGDVISRGVSTLGKLFMKESEEQAVGEVVGAAVEKTGIPQFIEGLSPRAQRNAEAVLGVGEFATLRGLGSISNKGAKAAFKKSDEVLEASRARVANVVPVTAPQLSSIVKDARFSISDINPQVETVLKRSSFEDVNRHFNQARLAANDTRQITPLELAGESAEEAYDIIDTARKNAVMGKKKILDEIKDQRVSGNTLNDVMSEGITRMNEQYGVKIKANGAIEDVSGRFSKLDATDQKLVSTYFQKLNSLGIAPTVKEVDDFIDWAQSQLYKQSKNLSTLESADKAVVRSLQGITGDLNARLKSTVGNGYGEVNARVAKLIELEDELSRSLGADARKGGGLMKRLFSPTGGNTRRVFEEIRKETGIDLDKEANLARFAMDNVGDVRQKSLLQQVNAGFGEAQQLDLTKPVSIINFIRERADLDAQELANEIIRRSNGATQ